MEDVFVRPMEEPDISAVSGMFTALYEYLHELGSLLRLNNDWLSDYLPMMLDTKLGRIFTLVSNGEVAGFICVSAQKINRKFVTGDAKLIGMISELYIDPSHRGKSYARMLLSAAGDYFDSLGIRRVQVEVIPGNRAAASLYESSGFAPGYTCMNKILQGRGC